MQQSHIVYCISMLLFILNFGWMDGADQGVLITGGIGTPRAAEVFLPVTGHSCRLPDLADDRYVHTQDGALTCGGNYYEQEYSCLKWSPDSGTWTQSHNLTEVMGMVNHVSWTPDSSLGTYLMGGDASIISEMVKPDGSVEQRFILKYDTR